MQATGADAKGVGCQSPTSELIFEGIEYRWSDSCFLTREQAAWALREVWRRCAGSSTFAGELRVVVLPVSREEVASFHAAAPGSVPWVDVSGIARHSVGRLENERLPLICVPAAASKHTQAVDPFPIDIVALTYLCLSRWEEREWPYEPDAWGNFPAVASVASRQQFIDRPVVDEWAIVLRTWLIALNPGWQACPEPFRIWMSHDIDHPLKFGSWLLMARAIGGRLVRERSIGAAARVAMEGARAWQDRTADPYRCGIDLLMALDDELGVKGTFFFMTADRSRYDEGYDLSLPHYRRLVDHVREHGHEVGWHPGYFAGHDEVAFQRQKERFERIAGGHFGVRFHYLRWCANRSWRMLEDAGCTFDASLGYNEIIGFRSGTAHPYRAFDDAAQAELALLERPLIIQDTASSFVADRAAYVAAVETAITRVRAVGGELQVLIHNTGAVGRDSAVALFRGLLRT